jgi:hypothetical protein
MNFIKFWDTSKTTWGGADLVINLNFPLVILGILYLIWTIIA